MDKRTETAFVLDNEGNFIQKHVLLWPGKGVYLPFEDSWKFSMPDVELPSRLYSYAGGTVVLPWELEDDKWVTSKALHIDRDGIEVPQEMIEGTPKERIRVIGHFGNAILVISWPNSGSHTMYIFDSHKRLLTTALSDWSLGDEPVTPFCKGIAGPFVKFNPDSVELTIIKNNKLKTNISFALPTGFEEDEKLPIFALTE